MTAKQKQEVIGVVERVAQAILDMVPIGYGMTIAEADEYARAAIEAMREPTDAISMVEREAIRAAIIDAINEVGMAAFKRTSLFMSNHAALNEQVAG